MTTPSAASRLRSAGERLPELGQRAPPRLDPQAALFLDFDGTLTDLAMRPEQVVVPPYLPVLLEAAQNYLAGAVAVLTGRRLADVDALLAPAVLIGAGVHGAEIRLDPCNAPRVLNVPQVAELIACLREYFAADRRVIVEDKCAGVALHYRMAPELADECIEVMQRHAGTAGLDVLVGNMVVEARAHGAHKGKALTMLASARPFAGRTPVFVGDDVTDEDGFVAAASLGGFGVKVGEGASAARFRVATVKTVYDWLHTSVGSRSDEPV